MFLIAPLALLAGCFLPRRALGRRTLLGASAVMLAIFGFTLEAILAPNSDTSIQESNWQSHSAHGFFVAALAIELGLAALYAFLAFRQPAPGVVRALFAATAVGTWLIGYGLIFALSN